SGAGHVVHAAGAGAGAERPEGASGGGQINIRDGTSKEKDMMRMINRIMLATMCLLMFASAARPQPSTQPATDAPSKADARRAIDEFLKSPQMGPQAKLIMEYAEKSEDVLLSPFSE